MDEAELTDIHGEDLFKQLLRLLPTADHQDYIKNGHWQDQIMRLDARILIGHRQEAGAPEIVPLEEVQMPETIPKVPKAPVSVPPSTVASVQAGKPGLTPRISPMAGILAARMAAAKAAALQKPAPAQGQSIAERIAAAAKAPAVVSRIAAAKAIAAKLQARVPAAKLVPPTLRPVSLAAKPVVMPKLHSQGTSAIAKLAASTTLSPSAAKLAKAMATISAAKDRATGSKAVVVSPGGPAPAKANPAYKVVANDMGHIALFVTKWSLDPTKAKMALAKLPAAKRQYVMTNFKNAAAVPTKYGAGSSVPAIIKLQHYIQQCEKSNIWAAATSSASSAGTAAMHQLAAQQQQRNYTQGQPTAIIGATSASVHGMKRPLGVGQGTIETETGKRLRLPGSAAGSAPYMAADARQRSFVAPAHKAAPPAVQNSWFSSNSAAKPWDGNASKSYSSSGSNSWDKDGSADSGKSWGGSKSWGSSDPRKPQAQKPESGGGGGIISSLLSKY